MKRYCILIFVSLALSGGCGFKEREDAIRQKQAELSKKEQQLILWEQRLAVKEKQLEQKKRLLDSTGIEIAITNTPGVTGRWMVRMQCVETSCDASAIGDIKSEQWQIDNLNHTLVAKAYSGKLLSRIYSGSYSKTGVELTDKSSGSETIIKVNLRVIDEKKMDGIREVLLPDCKIIYSLNAERLQ